MTVPTKILAAAVCAGLFGAACSPIVQQHGNLIASEKLNEIRPGATTKDEVQRILGTPSTLSTFNDRSWYYVSRRTSQVAFFAPSTESQESVAIDFDTSGVVAGVRQFDLRDSKSVELVARQTPSVGKELGFLEQLIGNIGKFNAARRTDSGNRGEI
ncbi:Beta-barrel assembly machine subunit BamE [Stella humosa]|uniref:Beta-barrel assembly machine subunit BamE n=1 Tax=Stella humosa TaxID=94 RepID=A0A3N1MBH4_9PROT|nr:outer membrane protein assembly factor BamE [Stella humosa]ROQ01081.1 Beta-barrel assembly machine subunit BamE [Stella humosa]BBK31453.1 outer membrane protein assembly factor BamE [Stella humosa]